ncbi:MAG: protein-S-isoprenylcysteine methyltransferase [Cyclobacterium sp.]|nr:protein-S-isoprenylcysteine methyltransferase [Cyclobacterium sp.]
MSNLLMVLSWGLFYFLHTALAASKLKRILKAKWPEGYKWYRLFYSILSTLLFLAILVQAIFLPVELVYPATQFGQYAGYMIATAGVIILMRSLKQVSMKSFPEILPEKISKSNSELITSGMYSQVRHPLYFGLLLVFAGYFLVSGTMGALIHLGCLILYLPLGIYFEEKNLISHYGERYREYQKEVPPFFPKIHKKRG